MRILDWGFWILLGSGFLIESGVGSFFAGIRNPIPTNPAADVADSPYGPDASNEFR
jgi:hypothetical protein